VFGGKVGGETLKSRGGENWGILAREKKGRGAMEGEQARIQGA